jgi:hypothetical protein
MNEKLHKGDTLPPIPREAIAARAYQIYLERGRQDGHDVDDWLQAEYELRQMPVRVLAKMKPTPVTGRKKTGRSLVDVVKTAVD